MRCARFPIRFLTRHSTAFPRPIHRPFSDSSTHFGFQTIPIQDKKEKVGRVFRSVADSYDVMNDVMSAGIHRIWKHEFVRRMRLSPSSGPVRILDVAGGTGDIAFRCMDQFNLAESKPISPFVEKDALDSVTVCDINPEMLRVGRAKAESKGYLSEAFPARIEFVQGDAENLPFEDASFDIYSIAFGLRNVTHIDLALKEAFRVLKPGGRIMILEFSSAADLPEPFKQIPGLENAFWKIYDAYSFSVIPLMGQVVAKDKESYQYLVESIRKFPSQPELLRMLVDTGFDPASAAFESFSGGIVAIHSAFKL